MRTYNCTFARACHIILHPLEVGGSGNFLFFLCLIRVPLKCEPYFIPNICCGGLRSSSEPVFAYCVAPLEYCEGANKNYALQYRHVSHFLFQRNSLYMIYLRNVCKAVDVYVFGCTMFLFELYHSMRGSSFPGQLLCTAS